MPDFYRREYSVDDFEIDQEKEILIEKDHGICFEEILEVFLSEDKQYFKATRDNRYLLLGKTEEGRCLMVVFALRNGNIRIITSRNMDKKEKHLYRKYGG